ncbi:MAG: RNA polymerase factor sigma-32 [Cryobacterium sp.]|nr:RNA polymerase factor sigma-32 [Oligoflexia bacterium]
MVRKKADFPKRLNARKLPATPAQRRADGTSAAATPELLPAEKKPRKPTSAKKKAPKSARSFENSRKNSFPAEDNSIEDDSSDETLDTDSEEVDPDNAGPEPIDGDNGDPSTEISSEIASLDENVERSLSKVGSAISATDPLRRYLDEVRHYSLLSPEEEISLATRLHETGDIDAAKRLVQANLRLVVKIAFEYKSVYANVMDLIQEGNIGLMKGVSKYDLTKGARVGYYSSWWIRSYILKYLLDNFRLVRVGTTAAQKKLFFHLMREKDRLEALGLGSAPKLIADRLHVREKDVVEMEKRLGSSGNEVSLDAPVAPHGETKNTYVDFLEDTREAVDDRLARDQLLGMIRTRLPAFEKTLNDREKKLLRDRMLAEEPKTLQEVADLYGLTRERARQIEAGVLVKLREFLKSTMR